jgi:hypothetical protein
MFLIEVPIIAFDPPARFGSVTFSGHSISSHSSTGRSNASPAYAMIVRHGSAGWVGQMQASSLTKPR